MEARIRKRREALAMAVAVVVALAGIAALVIMERKSGKVAQSNGISMITTVTVQRAGATAFPTDTTTPR